MTCKYHESLNAEKCICFKDLPHKKKVYREDVCPSYGIADNINCIGADMHGRVKRPEFIKFLVDHANEPWTREQMRATFTTLTGLSVFLNEN